MVTAAFAGQTLAQSDETVVVEGNHYFPPSSINWDFFEKTDQTTVCPWKGTASYYNVKVGDEVLENVAWAYPEASDKANNIKGHIAFYPKVDVNS